MTASDSDRDAPAERHQGRDEQPVGGQPVGQLRMGVEQAGQDQPGLTGRRPPGR